VVSAADPCGRNLGFLDRSLHGVLKLIMKTYLIARIVFRELTVEYSISWWYIFLLCL
jgi:hypothetical protein